MKKYILNIWLLGCLGLFLSCNDLDGKYDELVPDEYHKILSIKKTGSQEVIMSVEEEAYEYQLTVIKGGLRKDLEANAFLEVLTQDEVDVEYNDKQGTNYRVLSKDMYVIVDEAVSILGDETGKTIRVTFKPKKIYGAIKEGGANVEYVLPVHLVSASDSVNADKNKVLLRCNVSPVVVSFGESREQLILNSAETYHVVPVSIVKKGALATDIQLDLISQADLDEKYGIPEGIPYKVLESDMYELPNSLISMGESATSIVANITFYPDKIYEAKKNNSGVIYVLPIRLLALSETANTDKDEMLLICGFHTYTNAEVTDKSKWKVAYGTLTYEPWGHAYSYLFDGNASNNFGWMGYVNDSHGGNYGNPYVVIDLGYPYFIAQLGAFSKWDVKAGGANFYITTDDVNAALSDNDWNILSGYQGEGEEYRGLHNRLKEYDATVNWIKVASISFPEDGLYWGEIPNDMLDNQLKTRYVKMEAIPSGNADRTAIWEFSMKKVTSVDGQPID